MWLNFYKQFFTNVENFCHTLLIVLIDLDSKFNFVLNISNILLNYPDEITL